MVELYHLHDKYIDLTLKDTEEPLTNLNEILGKNTFKYITEDNLKFKIQRLNDRCKLRVK